MRVKDFWPQVGVGLVLLSLYYFVMKVVFGVIDEDLLPFIIRSIFVLSIFGGIIYYLLFSEHAKNAEQGAILRRHKLHVHETLNGYIVIPGWKENKK